MQREYEYQIGLEEAGLKISSFLKSKGYSNQNMIDFKKDEGCIQINGQTVHLNHILQEKERLRVLIRETQSPSAIQPVQYPLDIVYEDEDLLVLNKVAGMPIHPSRLHPMDSLGNALAWYFKGQEFVYRCINRLDRDTSGLTVVAKHPVSGAILSQMVASKNQMQREYIAVVDGILEKKKGTVSAPIARRESECLLRVVDFKNGESAITHYEVLEEYASASMVRLVLETGRTHQIRVHMAYLGHPLLGDFLYHPAYAKNQKDRKQKEPTTKPVYEMDRQALHAGKLGFVHPMTGQSMVFEAPLPKDILGLKNRLASTLPMGEGRGANII